MAPRPNDIKADLLVRVPRGEAMMGDPKHGDIAWYENCVPGGDPYRVTVVYRHNLGWFNVAGTSEPIDPDHLAGKTLHLFWRDHRPALSPEPTDGA